MSVSYSAKMMDRSAATSNSPVLSSILVCATAEKKRIGKIAAHAIIQSLSA